MAGLRLAFHEADIKAILHSFLTSASCFENKDKEHLFIAGGMQTCTVTMEISVGVPQEPEN